jgi:hypothetical protein
VRQSADRRSDGQGFEGISSLEPSVAPLELEVVSLDLRQGIIGFPKEEFAQLALGVHEQRTLHIPYARLVAILLEIFKDWRASASPTVSTYRKHHISDSSPWFEFISLRDAKPEYYPFWLYHSRTSQPTSLC